MLRLKVTHYEPHTEDDTFVWVLAKRVENEEVFELDATAVTLLDDHEIEARIERWAEGDSNDEEIDGLLDIVRTLQAERKGEYE